ncbi:MAG: hypothetical protein GXY44_01390 [Phycisphaerales bacterium]|nr:hypothetical protein [Phycisphaerales bacterium]
MMHGNLVLICLLLCAFGLPATGTLAPQSRYSGAEPAAAECIGQGGGLPASGTFAMHGRPVDVLPDGHALLFVRARHYDLNNGRWLQRDPKGYIDGGNLYEAFGSNPARFVDPSGQWIAERVAEILAEKSQVTIGDVLSLGKELYLDPPHEIGRLTVNELELLTLLGGPQYGTPWTETTLSPWLQQEAQKRYAGLGATYRNRAMATLATRRRILYLLAFNSSAFSNYVTELYRVSRDINPIHFAAERGIQVGTGTETITSQKVSRWRASGEFVVYLALVKGFQAGPAAITRAAGGEVPGVISTGVVPGRSTTLNRSEIRFSQRTAGGRGRAEPLRQSLREHGFTKQIDVVEVSPGQYVAVDNTRLAIAQELRIGRIPVRVFQPEDPLSPKMIAEGRFGVAARTWGDAILFRTAKQMPPLPTEGTPAVPQIPGATP